MVKGFEVQGRGLRVSGERRVADSVGRSFRV